MARHSPLLELHTIGEGLLTPYGPDNSDILIVQAFDPVPIEYAAIRTSCAIFDEPHRSTIIVTGADRLSFLNRMATQELSQAKGFAPFTSRPSFWLNRKGRIDADMRVLHLPDRILLTCDAFAAERARAGLAAYVITEDVNVEDATSTLHHLALHGPASAALLARISTPIAGTPINEISPGQIAIMRIADADVIVDRCDSAGEIGLNLLVPTAHARAVYEALSEPWPAPDSANAQRPIAPSTDRARRIGWQALNIARIEAGSPLYYADFGPDSLPGETGVLRDRVSFTKGCYLGQEVVARMDALGHPKQRVVALRIEPAPAHSTTPDAHLRDAGASPDAYQQQAVTGTPVLAADAPDAPIVGAVTSSCLSPMKGNAPIALAMVKWSHSEPSTPLFLQLDGTRVKAIVQEGLTFFRRA